MAGEVMDMQQINGAEEAPNYLITYFRISNENYLALVQYQALSSTSHESHLDMTAQYTCSEPGASSAPEFCPNVCSAHVETIIMTKN